MHKTLASSYRPTPTTLTLKTLKPSQTQIIKAKKSPVKKPGSLPQR